MDMTKETAQKVMEEPMYHTALYFQAGATPESLEEELGWPEIAQKAEHTTFAILQMPCCGHRAEYATAADVPRADTPCPCGSGNYIVRYE